MVRKLILILFFCYGSIFGQAVSFPGAHGFGRFATGGKGGSVLFVTNLNDAGSGSLRAALTASGARTIIFRVGGTINLSSYISVQNPNFTIAGESAPGQGVQIDGSGGIQIETSNFIIRHMRFRGSSVISNLRIISANGQTINNGMIDHCSFSWPDTAEMNIAFESSTDRLEVKNMTVQNCILGEATRGILSYKGPYRISVYRTLFANVQQRTILTNYPEFVPVNDLTFEQINTIVHNCQIEMIQASFGTKLSAIGNERSNSPTSYHTVNTLVDLYTGGEWTYSNSYVYEHDNINSLGSIYDAGTAPYIETTPYYTSDITGSLILPASQLSDMLPTLGAFYWDRDATDTRYVNDYINNTGNVGTYTGTPFSLTSGTAYTDSDSDGMDDTWETTTFGDLTKGNNGFDLSADYTNLQMFLSYLAGDEGTPPPAPTCSDGIQNGDETGIDCGGSCSPCSSPETSTGAGARAFMNYLMTN